ncbi:MAG: FIST N-terminal domain-containing protein [Steroidobacteraceae bacterium]
MQVRQLILNSSDSLPEQLEALADLEPQLVLVFADPDLLVELGLAARVASRLPDAITVGCSTAGEIHQRGIASNSAVITAVRFDDPQICTAMTHVESMQDSETAGERLGAGLASDRPHTVMVLGQGLHLNGSAVIRGLRKSLGNDVALVGGLASDGIKFERTMVVAGGQCDANKLVVIGFCSPRLLVTVGSMGGWRPFGPIRRVTRCDGNVLYELDGEPALAVYRRYLGDHAQNLPGSALLFPFSMYDDAAKETGVTRTILGIDEASGAITLAGEIVADGFLRLMCASPDELINGAEMAAELARLPEERRQAPSFALLVSCVGRSLALGDRTEEEVEAVGSILGPNCVLAGFYSNGEVSSCTALPETQLHNQTMTLACFSEAA